MDNDTHKFTITGNGSSCWDGNSNLLDESEELKEKLKQANLNLELKNGKKGLYQIYKCVKSSKFLGRL